MKNSFIFISFLSFSLDNLWYDEKASISLMFSSLKTLKWGDFELRMIAIFESDILGKDPYCTGMLFTGMLIMM